MILISEKLDALCKGLFIHVLRTADHDDACMFQLIVVEFAEILHVHLSLLAVCNGYQALDLDARLILHVYYSLCNVRQLADSRRLDDDAVRMELVAHLLQRFCKIADERAANASRVHLSHLDA